MKTIVLKFGGTSVGNINRIKKICKIIASYKKKKYRVIVVSSAMSGVTNDLVNKSKLLSNSYQKVCLQKKVQFIDSNSIIQSSDKDPIHWSKETHHIFGKEIAKILLKDIKP